VRRRSRETWLGALAVLALTPVLAQGEAAGAAAPALAAELREGTNAPRGDTRRALDDVALSQADTERALADARARRADAEVELTRAREDVAVLDERLLERLAALER
jgi:hypothetical protein